MSTSSDPPATANGPSPKSHRQEHPLRARAIVREFRRRGTVSVSQLASSLGDADRALRNTLDFLKPPRGRVIVLDKAGLRLNPEIGILVGVEITGATATAVVTDFDFAEPETASAEVPVEDPTRSVHCVAKLIAELLERSGRGELVAEKLVGVGMTLPGPILRERNVRPSGKQASVWNRRPETGTILPGWDGFDIGGELARSLVRRHGIEPPRWKRRHFVWVENDASAGALGVHSRMRASSTREKPAPEDLVYVRVTWGIGAGIVNKGHLVTGAHGFAGELGHATVDPAGRLCAVCGRRGCLETVASNRAVERQLREVLSMTNARTTQAGSVPAGEVADLGQLLAAEHPAVDRAVGDAGRHLGAMLAQLCTVLDPECIVLGGMQAAHRSRFADGERPFVKAVESALRAQATTQVSSPERLEVTTWEDVADGWQFGPELLGALALVIDHLGDAYLLDPIETWMNNGRRGELTFA